jgi:hypothetical protein
MHKRDTLEKPYWANGPDVIDGKNRDGSSYTGFSVGNDLNREIIKPGENDTFPDGAIGIRADDDFWAVGALPYDEYKDTPIEKIAAKFWPELTDPVFRPDSGDPWWKAYWKQ